MTIPLNIVSKPTIDVSHQKIHEGNHFSVHKMYIDVVAATKYFLIIPPPVPVSPSDTVEIHIIFDVITEPGGTLQFFEDSTITDNGIPLDIVNNNRRSPTLSLVNVYEKPTVTNDGTLISEEASAIAGGELGETNRNDEEFILHPAKQYILKLVPYVVGPAVIITLTLGLEWYDNRPSTPI